MLELKSKRVYRQNLGSIGSLSWILWGSQNTHFEQLLSIFTVFKPPLNPHSIPQLTPNFACRHSLTSSQAYFTLKSFQDHLRLKKSIFIHCYTLLSKIFKKSLHRIERSPGISVFEIFEIWKFPGLKGTKVLAWAARQQDMMTSMK